MVIRLGRWASATVILGCVASHAAVIATDSFSITEARAIGGSLNGSMTETGGLPWTGGAQWILRKSDGNGYVGTKSSGSAGMGIPFSFTSHETLGDVATISLNVAYRQQDSSWFGIGFSSAANGGNIIDAGAVWLQIDVVAGTWSLRTNAIGATGLPTGHLSEAGVTFSSGTSNGYGYSLSYNSSTRTVTNVVINGVSVVRNYTLPRPPGSIRHVVFFGQKPYNTATGTRIDNFTLLVTPSNEEAAGR